MCFHFPYSRSGYTVTARYIWPRCVSDFQNNTGDSDSCSEDKQTDEDREHAEDELALKHQMGLRGLAYETCLQRRCRRYVTVYA